MGIRALRIAIEKTQTKKTEISSLHTSFAKLCLKAKCYRHARSTIEHSVLSFTEDIEPIDIMTYCYYRGMLLIGLQRLPEALESFNLVLQSPAQTPHKVQVTAMKKVILLELILNQKTSSSKNSSIKNLNYMIQ